MNSYKRAFGAVVAAAVIGSGAGLASPATAQPASPSAQEQEQAVLLDLLDILGLPVLSGIPGVGSVISLTDPVWSLPGVTNSYTWMSNGIPIPGATGPTYTPSAADAGTQITALVTGSLLGILPVSALTNAINIPLPSGGGGGGGETPDPFTLLDIPLLTGIPGVGETIGLTSILWSLPGVTTSVQWLSNGVPIPGATGLTFIPGADLAGTELSALITGTLAGLPLVSQLTSALGIAPAAPDAITATVVPTVSGSGKVGTTLTGTDPTWNMDDVTTTYQWLRNSVAIPGATQKTYTLVGDDFGKQVSLKTTGTRTSGSATPGTASSTPVLVKLGDALTASTPPSVSGKPAVGSLMTIQPGTWAGSPTPTFQYQWYADGAPISGAHASTYVVKLTDAGRRLAVLVTANRLGYAPGTAATAPLTVAKVASTTRLKLLKKKIKQGKAALLRITLAPGALRPAGKVKVFDGRRLLKVYTVRAADNSIRIVKLPRLKPGKHKLTARFAGTRATTASKSAPVVLTVVRKR